MIDRKNQKNYSWKNRIVLFNTKRNPATKSKDYEIVELKVYSITKLDLNYQIIAPIKK